MKQGITLTELALELERQNSAKADYVASTKQLQAATPFSDQGTRLFIDGVGEFGMNDNTHSQLASFLDIPAAYYKRMRKDMPYLLDESINAWLGSKDEKRMIRTLDGTARALLSDRYRRLDNYELTKAVLPTLMEVPDMQIASCEVTDSKLYIKALSPRVQGDVKLGDTVQAGVVISNSEVGAGAVSVFPMSYRLVCLNGMTHADFGTKRNHVGRQIVSDETATIFKDDTLLADDTAFFLKVRDLVQGAMSHTTFDRILQQMRDAASVKIEGDVVESVTRLSNRYALTESENQMTLRNFIEGSDTSLWGLANAITATAGQVADYEQASTLERIGGHILQLDRAEMRELVSIS